MARNIQKNIAQAEAFLSKHHGRDLKVGEIHQFEEMFAQEIKIKGFWQGFYDLICNAFLFGFEVGRRAGKDDSKR